LEKCSKNGAKFDYKKGEWFNHQYLQCKSDEAIAELFMPILNEKGIQAPKYQLVKIAHLIKERIHFTTEIWDQSAFFFVAPSTYNEKNVNKYWKDDTPEKMQALISALQTIDDFSAKTTEQAVMSWIESNGYSTGPIMNALRLALVGESKGPHIFDITEILGKEEVMLRIRNIINKMTGER